MWKPSWPWATRARCRICGAVAAADVVTLHPETAQTRQMIGAAELAAMKPGAVLINAPRGSVVDWTLADALRGACRRRGRCLPVEPQGRRLRSPLCGMDNVILTPHVGGSTLEAQDNIGIEVASKLVRYSDNGSTLSAVNFPQVNLPEHPHSTRLLHIHANVPGVLSQINEVFSRAGVNIDGQYLQTSADIGYVVVDAGSSRAQANQLREALAAIPGTLRTRILY